MLSRRLMWFWRLSFRAQCLVVSGILLGLSLVSQVFSIANKETRLLLIVTAAVCLHTFFVLLFSALRARSRKAAYVLALLMFAAAILPVHFAHGRRTPDQDALRRTYVSRLGSFNHALYVWGGESHFGIDCSGLVRIALCEAMAQRAFVEGNPSLLGSAAHLWWRDMTAHCMRQHRYGYTRTIGEGRMLSEPDSIIMVAGYTLREGDLAIAGGGSHVLVYVGAGRWTEANPEDWRVVTNKAAGSRRAYFRMPVTILRWWAFADRA